MYCNLIWAKTFNFHNLHLLQKQFVRTPPNSNSKAASSLLFENVNYTGYHHLNLHLHLQSNLPKSCTIQKNVNITFTLI